MEKLIHDYSCELKGLDFTYNDYSKVKNTGLPLILTLYTKGVCNVKCPSCFINTFDKKYTELNFRRSKSTWNKNYKNIWSRRTFNCKRDFRNY